MFAAAVLFSVVGLLAGFALISWTRGSRTAFAALDGATLGIIPALVLLRLLPHLVEETGAWAMAACGAGYLVFGGIEARVHSRAAGIGMAIVLPALAVHGFLDGTGLALAFQHEDAASASSLAIGVTLVLHKIPEGLFVASVLLPTLGPRKTAVRLMALASATVLGALSGRELLAHTPDRALHLVVALGLGVMLRMAIHRHGASRQTRPERLASGLAFVICLASLLAVPDPEHLFLRAQPGELTAAQALAPLLLETAPWLLIALLICEWLAFSNRNFQLPARPSTSMWLPMVALSVPLLGPLATLVRAFLEPLCSAPRRQGKGAQAGAAQPLSRCLRSLVALAAPQSARVLPSFTVGVGLSIAIEAAMPGGILRGVGWLALPVASLPIVFRVGSAGVTVLAALSVHKGLPLAAAIVFSATAAHFLSLAQTKPSLRSSARPLLALVIASLVMWLLPPGATPPLHALASHPHPWVEGLAAATLSAWIILQLVWRGPRTWFAALRRSDARAST